jgi:acetyl esterase/lipase
MFEFRHQPFKSLYRLLHLLSQTFILAPLRSVLFLFPSLRPRRNWSWRRSLILCGLRGGVDGWFRSALPVYPGTLLGPEPEAKLPEGVGFVWVDPIPEEMVVGEVKEMAVVNDVTPARTCGYFYTRRAIHPIGPAREGEKVICHFHGGGYVVGSAHPRGGLIAPIAEGLLEYCTSVERVFGAEYRLCSAPPFEARNAFPAALLDAVAAYRYLVEEAGYEPKNVIISGDSAGGHLAFNLVRYLVSYKLEGLPVPGGLILQSPTCEWAATHTGPGSSWETMRSSDWCNSFLLGYTQRGLVGNLPRGEEEAETNSWISPGSLKLEKEKVEGMCEGFPRTYMFAGEAEMTRDSMRTLRDRLLGADNLTDDGSFLRYNEVKDGTHDILGLPFYEPERGELLKDIAGWLEAV